MIRHSLMWQFKDGLGEEEKAAGAKKIKQTLEGLAATIDDIVKIDIYIDPLPGSTSAVLFESYFADEGALKRYLEHPDHVATGPLVATYLVDKVVFDTVVPD